MLRGSWHLPLLAVSFPFLTRAMGNTLHCGGLFNAIVLMNMQLFLFSDNHIILLNVHITGGRLTKCIKTLQLQFRGEANGKLD